MLETFATMFSGGGGADLGLLAAGLRPVWAVERDPRIAAVYAENFGHWPIVADVCAVDYAALPRCDWLHASPECTRASKANRHAGESPIDLAVGEAVQRALVAMRPLVFTLENVWEYRRFSAFRGICRELERLGYVYDFDHVNAADHGVPQTRKRLILRASRLLLPPLPPAAAVDRLVRGDRGSAAGAAGVAAGAVAAGQAAGGAGAVGAGGRR